VRIWYFLVQIRDSDKFCSLFFVFDMNNHFLSKLSASHEKWGPLIWRVFFLHTLIAFGLFSVDDSVVNCARVSINNTDYLMKSALFNYPFQLSGSTARVYRIWSDNSPILATCLWVWLHQNFNSASDKFVMDWFIYSFERWQKFAHLTDCNEGWEVTNSKLYLSVNVPSRNDPA